MGKSGRTARLVLLLTYSGPRFWFALLRGFATFVGVALATLVVNWLAVFVTGLLGMTLTNFLPLVVPGHSGADYDVWGMALSLLLVQGLPNLLLAGLSAWRGRWAVAAGILAGCAFAVWLFMAVAGWGW